MLEPGLQDKQNWFPRLFVFSNQLIAGNPWAHNLANMVHIGKMIRKVLEKRGKTVVWLAAQLSCHRTNVYKIFARKSIDTSDLLEISRILEYDFFAPYSADFLKHREKENLPQ